MPIEKTTGLFMVQRSSANPFLGTVTCLVSGEDAGWTSGLLDTSAPGWSFVVSSTPALSLKAEIDMSLRFASILMVTSIQGLAVCDAHLGVDAVQGMAVRAGHSRMISITVPKTKAVKVLKAQEEGVLSFRVAPELARAVAMKIYQVAAEMWTLD